jgi:integrase
MSGRAYWFAARPAGVVHRHPFLVFDRQDHLHVPLTVFGKEAGSRVAAKTVQTYLHAILPFFTFLEEDEWQVRAGRHWQSSPEQVRQAIDDYLVQRLRCLVQTHVLSFKLIAITAGTHSTLRVFLSGLKLFYRVMQERGYYASPNPLVDGLATTVAQIKAHLEDDAPFPRMPEESGVETPRRKQRLSDSYFKLEGDAWMPQVVDDPTLYQQVLEGGHHLTHWNLRHECVTRILFESGGRISEVVGLTLGDWAARGCRREASAFDKGSHGRRVKVLRFWNDTAKLLRRYFDEERRRFDPQGYQVEDYLQLAKQRQVNLFAVPLFLSSQRTPLSAQTYREHAWNPACQAAGIEVDVHQARHWFVTMMVRQSYQQAKTEAEIQADRQALIQYMRWKSGEETLRAYDHYFDRLRVAELQDALATKLARETQSALGVHHGTLPGQQGKEPPLPTTIPPDAQAFSVDPDYVFLLKIGGASDGE